MFIFRAILATAAALAASSCAKLTLAWADLDAKGQDATPALFDSEPDPARWRSRKDEIRDALEMFVYGTMPDASETRIVEKRLIDEAAFGGRARLEEWTISASATFGAETVSTRGVMDRDGFLIQVALPARAEGPAPIIIMETFCPWWDVMQHPGVSRPADANSMNGGVFGSVATYIFGRYICTPPVEMILDKGYALASVYPSAIVPDSADAGLAELARLSAGLDPSDERWGAIAAWGWLFSRVVDAVEDDPRFDASGEIVWGHSRYAKAALVAAAWDDRIDGVIAHQSGTGGASLNRDKPGESVKEITSQYPHWFARRYAAYAGRENELPIDQHHLLALIAPRPVLLGNARRDVWSDPAGAFRAARAADAVYELFGREGLAQDRLVPFNPDADIAFWIRPGTHGVVKEDWPAFLDFLEAHFDGEPAT